MFHVKQTMVLLVLLSVFVAAKGQGVVIMDKREFNAERLRDPEIEKFLADYQRLTELTALDQDAFYWINLFRQDPARFYRRYVIPFGEQFPELRTRNFKSLEADCQQSVGLPLLGPAEHLQREAARHAEDLAKHIGRISHSASDGRDFARRMSDADVRRCGGENVFEGESEALVALILLLIDEGVPGLGHRKALLNPSFNIMGVASEEAKTKGRFFMVQLFSCR